MFFDQRPLGNTGCHWHGLKSALARGSPIIFGLEIHVILIGFFLLKQIFKSIKWQKPNESFHPIELQYAD